MGSTNKTRIGPILVHDVVIPEATEIIIGDTTLMLTPLDTVEEVKLASTDRFGPVLGKSPAMRELFSKLEAVASQNVTVLLEGETGTGKELIARAIHQASHRRDRPFIVVDCGAIPESLLQSELFGHVAGAFTGATSDRPGAFEEADSGTIFLDEIGELDLALQTPPVAGPGKPRDQTARTFPPPKNRCASDCCHQPRPPKGSERRDLSIGSILSLAVMHLRIAPLRKRPEDIELMVTRLLPSIAKKLGVATPELSPETFQHMLSHSWPGNGRELRNFLERITALTGGGLEVKPEAHLTPGSTSKTQDVPMFPELLDKPFHEAKALWTEHFDKSYLSGQLERSGHNATKAAEESGLNRAHMFRLIKKYRLRQR